MKTSTKIALVLSPLWILLASFASADCSNPRPENLSIVVKSCTKTEADQIAEHLSLFQFGRATPSAMKNEVEAQAKELIDNGSYRGIVINADSRMGSKPYFIAAGLCQDFPPGRSLTATVGTACCDGDPNPPCYLGFANFLVDPSLPRIAPISGGAIGEWLAFDPEVELMHVRSNPNLYSPNADPNLFFSDAYTSNSQSRTQVHIMLFPYGKMFGSNRESMMNGIEKQRAYAEQNPDASKDLFIGKVARHGNRITTYAYLGGGPGGERYGAFTELGRQRHELLVQLLTFSEDSVPVEQRPETWSKPHADLRSVMPKIEAHFLEQLKSEPTYNP